ncbi:hypothetical protein D3C72_2082420 [compost metagenome]
MADLIGQEYFQKVDTQYQPQTGTEQDYFMRSLYRRTGYEGYCTYPGKYYSRIQRIHQEATEPYLKISATADLHRLLISIWLFGLKLLQ